MAANDELAVLRTLRLKGRATTDELVAATGADPESVESIAGGLLESGGAKEMRGALVLLPPARERLEALLAAEREGIDQDALRALYEEFTDVNGDFKVLATDWQLRDNDVAVLDRLPGIHARVIPIIGRVAQQSPRLARYGDRLTAALNKVQGGEHEWLLKPLIDSYHTVWFELHEELISLAGLTRLEEAAAGRAQ